MSIAESGIPAPLGRGDFKSRPKSSKTRVRSVRTVFPISVTAAMKALWVGPRYHNLFRKCYPPDYQHGKVGRYTVMPVEKELFAITSGVDPKGVEIRKLFSGGDHIILFTGTKAEVNAKVEEYLMVFWSLRRGKELDFFRKQAQATASAREEVGGPLMASSNASSDSTISK